MKLANNFLSATALAATSEAIAFGLAHGLDMATMIDVLNVSTGRNSATVDKFPNRILTGTYDAGFSTAHMTKDVGLFVDGAASAGTAARRRLGRHRDMARLRRRAPRQRLHRDLAVRLDVTPSHAPRQSSCRAGSETTSARRVQPASSFKRAERVVRAHERVAGAGVDGERDVLAHALQLGLERLRRLRREEVVVLGHVPADRRGRASTSRAPCRPAGSRRTARPRRPCRAGWRR